MKNLILTTIFCLLAATGVYAQTSGTCGTSLNWSFDDLTGTLTISGNGDMADYSNSLDVPWTIEGIKDDISTVTIENGVTSIGVNAFAYCPALTSVAIPSSVTSIGDFAFGRCYQLASITIPSSVESIGHSAFSYCVNLTSIIIQDGVKNIMGSAFAYCTVLTSITIPSSVTNIGDYAFACCYVLTSIDVANGNSAYASENGVLFNKEKTTLVRCPAGKSGDYTIPNGVETIEKEAFAHSILTSVTIPSSVESIGWAAFFNSYNVSSITNLNKNPQNQRYNASFDYVDNKTLYVPFDSKIAYEHAPGWGEFPKIIGIYTIDNPQSHPDAMYITAIVQLDEEEITEGKWQIAAFCGTECRGTVLLKEYGTEKHPFQGLLTVYGEDGDAIKFKVLNLDTEESYDATNADFTFNSAYYEKGDNPYIITIGKKTQQIDLIEGWNWISSNVSSENPSLFEQFKLSTESNSDLELLGSRSSGFVQRPYWVGELSVINNTDMYKVKTSAESFLLFEGVPVDPDETPITIKEGWNWIGYTPWDQQSVENALENLKPENNDMVKSQFGYSVKYNGDWLGGNLTTMKPGKGYMYLSNASTAKTLVYSTSIILKGGTIEETPNLKWTTDVGRFANNMTLTSIVLSGNEELQSDQIEIGAFSGNECRGSVRLKHYPQVTTHPYMGFLMVYGENNDAIRFRIYNHATGKEYEAGNLVSFAANAIHGTPAAPLEIKSFTTGITGTPAETLSVYTDAQGKTLYIKHPWNSIDRLEIVDITGRTLLQENGFTAESISISSFAQGMYIVKLFKDNHVSAHKIIKK